MQEPNNTELIRQLDLERTQQSGARWFYWIAALTVINSMINMNGGGINFIVGLSASQFVDGLAIGYAKDFASSAVIGKTIALIVNILLAGVFFMFGKFAYSKQNLAFMLGMICYGADALLGVPFGEWLGVGFHLFALFCIYGGMQANKKLQALQAAAVTDPAPAS
jgi:hypothetical protein